MLKYFPSIFFGLGILLVLEPKGGFAHLKCPVKKPWGGYFDSCPHGHMGTQAPPPSTTPPPETGLKVCNRSSSTASVAIVRERSTRNSYGSYSSEWTSSGWYNVSPGACSKVYSGDVAEVRVMRAESRGVNWGGDLNYCVSPQSAFEYRETTSMSIRESQLCRNEHGGVMRGFTRRNSGVNTWNLNN
jgi:uncharacterized membrane protein